MVLLRIFMVSMTFILGACASQDGTYEPSCIAYEGDRVLLMKNRFEWHKFTDQREIDGQGKVIEPFPNYPKVGAFELQAGRIEFISDDGSVIDDHFMVNHLENWYLMPPDDHQRFLIAGELSNCALRRRVSDR